MKKRIEILVHPFDEDDLYENHEQYVQARAKKLEGVYDLLILTSNPEHLKKMIQEKPAIIIPSEDYSARPIQGWKLYNQFVSNYQEVVISGAELKLNQNGVPVNGCVLHAYEETQHSNKSIDIDSCWISKL